jgi:hypothetical protein
MQTVQRWLEKVYRDRICDEYDAIVVILGGEGNGKSTLITELTGRWRRLRDRSTDPEDIIGRVVWQDRTEFKNELSAAETRSVVCVHDAARVLHKKEAMAGEQVEIEKDLLDVRRKEFLMLLGYQDWGVVPSMLQNRRATFVLRVPERGTVEGYSREKIDQRVDHEEWPEPDLVDSFPDLSGTEVWEQFKRTDEKKKNERLAAEDDPDPEEAVWREKAITAVRLVQPWEPQQIGASYSTAGSIVGYSKTWVADRVDDWRKGKMNDAERLPNPKPQDKAKVSV